MIQKIIHKAMYILVPVLFFENLFKQKSFPKLLLSTSILQKDFLRWKTRIATCFVSQKSVRPVTLTKVTFTDFDAKFERIERIVQASKHHNLTGGGE